MTLEGEEIGSQTSVKVKLSVAQIGTVIIAAASVIGSVWVTTRELKMEVRMLSMSGQRLSNSISKMERSFDKVTESDHGFDRRMILVENWQSRHETMCAKEHENLRRELERQMTQIERAEDWIGKLAPPGSKPPIPPYVTGD